MAAVLLDSTVLIDLLRRRPGATERLARLQSGGDTPFVCAVSVEEITRGLHPAEDDAAIRCSKGTRGAPWDPRRASCRILATVARATGTHAVSARLHDCRGGYRGRRPPGHRQPSRL